MAIARSSVHSHASASDGRDERDRRVPQPDAHDRGAQVELPLQRLQERLVDRRGEDRVRGERGVPRVASGNGCPTRIVASAPNGTCFSSSVKPCRRAAALMPRLAWAITSGPIPSPARHATE